MEREAIKRMSYGVSDFLLVQETTYTMSIDKWIGADYVLYRVTESNLEELRNDKGKQVNLGMPN